MPRCSCATVPATGIRRLGASLEDEFATYNTGHHKAAIAASLGPERKMRKAYEQSLATAQVAGQRSMHAASSSASVTSSHSLIILTVTLVAALVLGSAIVYWPFHTIAIPMFNLATLLSSA
jgi:hypothetical protein